MNFYTRGLNTKQNKVGGIVEASGANIACPNGSTTDILTVNLSAGVWVIIAMVSFNVAFAAAKRLSASIAYGNNKITDQRASFDGYQTIVNLTHCIAMESSGNVSIQATQNSGSENNVQCNRFVAVRIKG